MKQKILIATTNPGKMAELKQLLTADAEFICLADLGDFPEVIEDGQTFAENARKKACSYAKAANLWTIADDSGLEIDALEGSPGVKSARFSGEKSPDRTLIDHKNIDKVLQLMKNVPAQKRTARFRCAICLSSPEKILAEVTGKVEGIITEKQIGDKGFGYDPIFYVPSLGKTAGQMAANQKNKISHRADALNKLKPILHKLLKS